MNNSQTIEETQANQTEANVAIADGISTNILSIETLTPISKNIHNNIGFQA